VTTIERTARPLRQVPRGHRVQLASHEDEPVITYVKVGWDLYGETAAAWSRPSPDELVYDLGPLPRHQFGWLERRRQACFRRLLQVLAFRHKYHDLVPWTEETLWKEVQIVDSFFLRRRFEVALKRLTDAGWAVHHPAHAPYGLPATYELNYAGRVEAIRHGVFDA
jgi:hypothetical protein